MSLWGNMMCMKSYCKLESTRPIEGLSNDGNDEYTSQGAVLAGDITWYLECVPCFAPEVSKLLISMDGTP